MTETEEYACIKRVESQMRIIFKEYKSMAAKINVNQGVSLNEDLEHSQKIDKLLMTINQ